MTTRRTVRRSATIIEVAMALVILSVALPPLVKSFADASRQTIHPSQASVAAFLAIERMEEVVARRYRGTQGGVKPYDALVAANFPAETPVAGFGAYARRVTFSEVNSALQPSATPCGYRKARVTVSWNNGTQEVVMERLFADF